MSSPLRWTPARWAGRIACAICVALACAAALMWARSYAMTDSLYYNKWTKPNVCVSIYTGSYPGGFEVGWLHERVISGDTTELRLRTSRTFAGHSIKARDYFGGALPPPEWAYYWVRFRQRNYKVDDPDDVTSSVSDVDVSVPYWIIVVPTAAPALFYLAQVLKRRTRNRRIARGRCAKCAYDLRGIADRCPECGTPVPKRPNAIAQQNGKPAAA